MEIRAQVNGFTFYSKGDMLRVSLGKKTGQGIEVVMGTCGCVLLVGRDLREFMASIVLRSGKTVY